MGKQQPLVGRAIGTGADKLRWVLTVFFITIILLVLWEYLPTDVPVGLFMFFDILFWQLLFFMFAIFFILALCMRRVVRKPRGV